MRVPISPHSPQLLLLSVFLITAILVGSNSLWFRFSFSRWLITLTIFSCAYWPFVYLFWGNVYSSPLPTFDLDFLFIIELYFFLLWCCYFPLNFFVYIPLIFWQISHPRSTFHMLSRYFSLKISFSRQELIIEDICLVIAVVLTPSIWNPSPMLVNLPPYESW